MDLLPPLEGWLSVSSLGGTIVVGIYSFMTRGAREAAKAAAKAAHEIGDLKERVIRLETEIERLPDRELVQQMQIVLARLEATVEAQFRALSATVDRLQDYLERHSI